MPRQQHPHLELTGLLPEAAHREDAAAAPHGLACKQHQQNEGSRALGMGVADDGVHGRGALGVGCVGRMVEAGCAHSQCYRV